MISTNMDSSGHTPLAWAAQNVHEEVVKSLLGREEMGPHKVLRAKHLSCLLLGMDVRECWKSYSDGKRSTLASWAIPAKTPLSDAASGGNQGVVKNAARAGRVQPQQAK